MLQQSMVPESNETHTIKGEKEGISSFPAHQVDNGPRLVERLPRDFRPQHTA